MEEAHAIIDAEDGEARCSGVVDLEALVRTCDELAA